MLGIIGGTGLTQLTSLEITHRQVIRTPYGEPSGPLTYGNINNHQVVFLARHGYGHTIPPHLVNYRANLWALYSEGVKDVVSVPFSCMVFRVQVPWISASVTMVPPPPSPPPLQAARNSPRNRHPGANFILVFMLSPSLAISKWQPALRCDIGIEVAGWVGGVKASFADGRLKGEWRRGTGSRRLARQGAWEGNTNCFGSPRRF